MKTASLRVPPIFLHVGGLTRHLVPLFQLLLLFPALRAVFAQLTLPIKAFAKQIHEIIRDQTQAFSCKATLTAFEDCLHRFCAHVPQDAGGRQSHKDHNLIRLSSQRPQVPSVSHTKAVTARTMNAIFVDQKLR